MIVKLQILTDDGETVISELHGNAFSTFGVEFEPSRPLAEGGLTLRGFHYSPSPPPRDPPSSRTTPSAPWDSGSPPAPDAESAARG